MRWGRAAALVVLFAARAEALESEPVLRAAVLPAETAVARGAEVEGSAFVRLRAARGERQPALVVVRASQSGLFTARVSALANRNGAVIPASSVELSQVEDVQVAGAPVPDRLEPLAAAELLPAEKNLLLWVEVSVPRSAEAGSYHGTLQLSAGNAVRNLPLEVEVLPLTLPHTPTLATSFVLPPGSGPLGAYAHLALQERVTLRLAAPPPFRVTPLEGTLVLDFEDFDLALAPLLQPAEAGPSSIALSVPRSVPAPRRLEYLLAVKRHLAERGCGELLVNFGEEGSLLRGVQGRAQPSIALVQAHDDAPAALPVWWRLGGGEGASHDVGELGSDAPVNLDDSARWLQPGASGVDVRRIGWSAFHAGAVGLFAQDPVPLLYTAEDGSPRESVRLKLLREGLEDYELLTLAARRDPAGAKKVAQALLGQTRGVDFEAAREELVRLSLQPRPGSRGTLGR